MSGGRDSGRSALYSAEEMIRAVFDAPGGVVTLAGTTLTVPPEARFASAASVADHVARVLARPSVCDRFPRATTTVAVRSRRGASAAHYEPGPPAVIAVPQTTAGRWALRETVVLHEIAHHLDDTGGAPHDDGFVATLVDLVADVMGPEAGLIYRVMLANRS